MTCELTYELVERGERVVLLHASAFVSWYGPLVEQLPDLSTLRYRRRLLPSDGGGYRPLTVAEDAAFCARLMDHVGWPTAHVVGHSYGALVALQLAIDTPERVRFGCPARARRPWNLQLSTGRCRPAARPCRLQVR